MSLGCFTVFGTLLSISFQIAIVFHKIPRQNKNFVSWHLSPVEKKVSVACHLLRFSLDAAINSKKKEKKYTTNATVFCSPQHILKQMLRFFIARSIYNLKCCGCFQPAANNLQHFTSENFKTRASTFIYCCILLKPTTFVVLQVLQFLSSKISSKAHDICCSICSSCFFFLLLVFNLFKLFCVLRHFA